MYPANLHYMRYRMQLGPVTRHPVLVLALKGAVAAGLAWVAVGPLGGVADDYRYYAPLGAVVATSTTAARSWHESVRALAAIVLGALVALVALCLPLPQLAGLVLATGVAVGIGGWDFLGGRASWVPVTALFVLLVGDSRPWHYALGYAGLTALGVLVGILVDAAAPQRHEARGGVVSQSVRRPS